MMADLNEHPYLIGETLLEFDEVVADAWHDVAGVSNVRDSDIMVQMTVHPEGVYNIEDIVLFVQEYGYHLSEVNAEKETLRFKRIR